MGSGAATSHSYTRPGVYKATLKVSDGTSSSTITRDVFVAGPAVEPPKAEFAFSPGKPVVGQAVSFTDRSTNAASWSWEFGDGSTERAQNPTHAYAAKGTYTVTLTVTNSAGQTASTTQSVTVDAVAKAPPEARFAVRPAGGRADRGQDADLRGPDERQRVDAAVHLPRRHADAGTGRPSRAEGLRAGRARSP